MQGKEVRGRLSARDVPDLSQQLRQQQLFLLEAREIMARSSGYRLKSKQLVDFNFQLGSMLRSGVTMVRALEILASSDIKPQEQAIYENLLQQLITGVALSDAMAAMGKTFPELLINMYRAGEANGTIDKTAMEMANHYDKDAKLRAKISSATAYPKFLGGLLVVIVVGIFKLIMPRFMAIYGDMELPKITQVVIAVSKLFTDYFLYTAIGATALIVGITLLSRTYKFKYQADRLTLHSPIIGPLMRTVYTARFARTLSSLYASGLTILHCLEISRNTIGNVYIEAQFDQVIDSVRNGGALSAAVMGVDGFLRKLAMIVTVGEESGQLDQMLLNVADTLDFESQKAVDKMTSTIEPLMIVIMALLVAIIIVAVMLPIYNMYSAIDAAGMTGV